MTLTVETLPIPGPLLVATRRHPDARGHFAETWNARAFAAAGIAETWVQDNESLSRRAGTVRGLHAQAPPHAQAKLVRVLAGAIRDVVVDARRGSPAFGRWAGVELSAGDGRQLYVPAGFLHGFATLADDTVVAYKCSDFYAPAADGAVRWDDPDLAIDWGIDPDAAILSDRDARAPRFADWASPFRWEGA